MIYALRIISVTFFAIPTNLLSQSVEKSLTPEELTAATAYLKTALAAPKERAFLQVITEVSIIRNPTDTLESYDLVVLYDPFRFRDPHVGVYPLKFSDQLIIWAKRVSLFTRSTRWKSNNFYLHDLSTGRQAWIFIPDARQLYPEKTNVKFPATVSRNDTTSTKTWLKLIHETAPTTNLSMMSRWFRIMHNGSREQVINEKLQHRQAKIGN